MFGGHSGLIAAINRARCRARAARYKGTGKSHHLRTSGVESSMEAGRAAARPPRTRARSRPWQPSRTYGTAAKHCAVQRRCMRSRPHAPRMQGIWLGSQPRAAAMGKDRKKVGNAYVHTYRCTCMHVCTYVPIFVRESVRVRE